MADRVYKKITVTGCSEESYERAIRVAVSKASESIRGMAWFEVGEMRGDSGEECELRETSGTIRAAQEAHKIEPARRGVDSRRREEKNAHGIPHRALRRS